MNGKSLCSHVIVPLFGWDVSVIAQDTKGVVSFCSGVLA